MVYVLINDAQIVREQLAFPSGLATAHLISALHRLPPPEDPSKGLRKRNGYEVVDSDEIDARVSEETPPLSPQSQDLGEGTLLDEEVVRHDGWQALLWSFVASALLTVSITLLLESTISLTQNLWIACSLFLPCHIRNPSLRSISSA